MGFPGDAALVRALAAPLRNATGTGAISSYFVVYYVLCCGAAVAVATRASAVCVRARARIVQRRACVAGVSQVCECQWAAVWRRVAVASLVVVVRGGGGWWWWVVGGWSVINEKKNETGSG
eukprot:scaffold1618_cov143-Isochrysis_galbana.AAC.3